MSTILIIPTDGQQLEHLNHALESWRQFGPDIAHIIVVGETKGLQPNRADMPGTLWRIPQLQNQPRLNQQLNLASVLNKNWADDVTFIWSHDDIFLTRPFTLEELTRLSWCALRESMAQKWSLSKVAQATMLTLEQLEIKGLPAYNYELHLPLVIHPAERQDWIDLMPRNDMMQFRSWVLNHLAERRPTMINDVKVFKGQDKHPALGIYSTAKNIGPRVLKPIPFG